MSFIIGLDLGQSQDFTAIAAVERVGHDPSRRPDYHVRHLERPPLGTPYPVIVQRVSELMATPPLAGAAVLILDQTGVGRAIFDLFRAARLAPFGVTITGGDAVSHEGRQYRIPKRDLVGVLVALFPSGRLKIAEGLAEGATLVKELTNFRMKIKLTTGHDTYEAWREGAHDDLVLSVALACWLGEQWRPVGAAVAGGERANPLVGYRSDIRGLRPPRRY